MIYILLCFLLSVHAQEEAEMAELEEAVQEVKQTESSVVEELSNVGTSEIDRLLQPFRYDPQGKRDPFIKPEGEDSPLYGHPVYGPFLSIQEVPLNKVKLRGVFIHPQNSKALFEIPGPGQNPKMIKLGLKDYIGENFGYIAAIRPGKVIIVQTKEQNGEKFSTTRTLSIEK